MTYNINDMEPETGREIRTDGSLANPADSVDSQGNQGVVINGEKVIGPILLDTIPFGSFTASGTVSKMYSGVLNRNAKSRTFHVSNNLNQPIPSGYIYMTDSQIQNGAKLSYNGGSYLSLTTSMAAGTAFSFGSLANPGLGANVDSVQFNLTMGATAPTSGNAYIYVTEVL